MGASSAAKAPRRDQRASSPPKAPTTRSKKKADAAHRSPRKTPQPAQKKTKTPKTARPAKETKKQRELAASRKAWQAKKRKIERQAIIDAEFGRRSEAAKKGAATKRAKKQGPDERELAMGWLETMRDISSEVTPTSIDFTEATGGGQGPWLVVGRLQFAETISYEELGELLQRWQYDHVLSAMIHPQRLSQIRVVYNDPTDKRGSGDAVISKIGAWEYVIGDMITEVVGGGPDDESSLAVRYDKTSIDKMYVFFSTELVGYRSAWKPDNATTHTVKIR